VNYFSFIWTFLDWLNSTFQTQIDRLKIRKLPQPFFFVPNAACVAGRTGSNIFGLLRAAPKYLTG